LLLDLAFEAAHALGHLLGDFAVVPKVGFECLMFKFFQFISKTVQVKDSRRLSSSAPQQLPVLVSSQITSFVWLIPILGSINKDAIISHRPERQEYDSIFVAG
jgi:hypothetical protein